MILVCEDCGACHFLNVPQLGTISMSPAASMRRSAAITVDLATSLRSGFELVCTPGRNQDGYHQRPNT
jgi:hypothetical protein